MPPAKKSPTHQTRATALDMPSTINYRTESGVQPRSNLSLKTVNGGLGDLSKVEYDGGMDGSPESEDENFK